MRLGRRPKKIWDLFANFWTAKDILLAVAGTTTGGAIMSGLAVWAFSPMSPFDGVIVICVGATIAFFMALLIAPKMIAIPQRRRSSITMRAACTVSHVPSDRSVSLTYMTASEVIRYLRDESIWGANKATEISPNGMRYNVGLEAFGEFAHGASQGGVAALGRLDGHGAHIEIPASYWLSASLDMLETLNAVGKSRTAATVLNGPSSYEDVRIALADVKAKWPAR